jgi:hypothetical protein
VLAHKSFFNSAEEVRGKGPAFNAPNHFTIRKFFQGVTRVDFINHECCSIHRIHATIRNVSKKPIISDFDRYLIAFFRNLLFRLVADNARPDERKYSSSLPLRRTEASQCPCGLSW